MPSETFSSNSNTSVAPKHLSLDGFFARAEQLELLKTYLLAIPDEDQTTTALDASSMSVSYSSFGSMMSSEGSSRASTCGKRRRKSNAQVVLVSGVAGVGKTTLLLEAVQAVQKGLTDLDNPLLFGAAKFDSRTSPVEAIQSCVDTIVQKVQQAGDLDCEHCAQQQKEQGGKEGDRRRPSIGGLANSCRGDVRRQSNRDATDNSQGEEDQQYCECLKAQLHKMEEDHRELLIGVVPSTARLFSENTGINAFDVVQQNDDDDQNSKHSINNSNHSITLSNKSGSFGSQEMLADEGGDDPGNFANNKDGLLQLQVALKSLFRALSQRRKVVLMFDDLHRAPADSFDLLAAIATDFEANNIVLCGTMRDGETTQEFRKFQRKLSSRLRSNAIHTLHVGNFTQMQVHHMMVELLDSDDTDEMTEELSRLIHQRTAGNIFFIRELLDSLQQDELIQYDWMTGKWKCDIALVQKRTAVSENVLQVVVHKIQKLEPKIQSLVQLCACLGSKVNLEWIEICLPAFFKEQSGQLHKRLLRVACSEHLMDDLGSGWYKFSHDMVHESVRLLLPTGKERDELHWRLGQLLLDHIKAEDSSAVKGRLKFLCADLINLGVPCASPKDFLDIAKLNLEAAKSASNMSAFHPACQYCQAGIDALRDQPVAEEDDDDMVLLDLYVLYAEMLHCTGDFNEAKKYCEYVFEEAPVLHYKVPCYITMMQVLNAEMNEKEVVDFGLRALKALGEAVPRRLSAVEAAFDSTKGSKSWISCKDEDVLALPLMKNKRKAACIQVMQCMLAPLNHLSSSDLSTRILKRMMALTLKYGLTKWAPEAFAIAGADLVARKDDLDQGYRLGKLAVALIDRLHAKNVQGRVCFWTTTFTFWWKEPLPNCLDVCIDGYRCGMSYGDTHFAFYNIVTYAFAYFYSGLPLKPLLDDLDKYCHQMIEYRQFMVLYSIIPCWQSTLNLCGEQPTGPLDMTQGLAIDKQDIAGNDKKVGEQACWSFLMQISFYLGDMERAAELSDRLQDLDLGLFRAEVFYPSRVFFFALTAIERYRTTGKRKYKQKAKKQADLMSKWISNGAINLTHKGLILRAELSTISSKVVPEESQGLYDKAFSTAMRAGFLQDAALACQLAAAFCETDLPEYTAPYAVKAWENWQAWDAVVVAEHIEQMYPDIFGGSDDGSMSSDENGGSTRSHSSAHKGRPRFSITSSRRHLQVISQEFGLR